MPQNLISERLGRKSHSLHSTDRNIIVQAYARKGLSHKKTVLVFWPVSHETASLGTTAVPIAHTQRHPEKTGVRQD